MKVILALLVSALFYNVSLAQSPKLGSWYNYFGSMIIGSRFNLHHEVQYRNYNAIGDIEQLLLRTGIGYDLTENNNNVLLGYGFIYSENYQGSSDIKTDNKEHRIFQQFITKQQFGRLNMQHRFRIEERIIANDVKFRGRYFLGMNIALNHSEMIDKTLYISSYDEVFLNRYESHFDGQYNSIDFDRNRAYAGLGFKFNKNIKVELAYMNQFFSKGFQRDQINIACFANF